jgi:hypothetical protein
MFSLPTMAVAAENDLTLSLCVTMTTIPAQGIISKEVVLSLSTVDGTGGC